MKMLLPYLRPYKKQIIGSLIFAVPLALLKTYQISLVKPIFDQGFDHQSSWKDILFLAGLLLAAGIINYPARFFHFYWMRTVVDKATCDIRRKLYEKFQKLPLSYFTESKIGNLLSCSLNDTLLLAEGFRGSVDYIREPLTGLGLLGYCLYLDWQLTLVIFVVTPLFIVIFQKSGKKVRRNVEEAQKALGEMNHHLQEGLSGQKITKAFGLQRYVINRFQKVQDFFLRFQVKTIKVEEHSHPLTELVGTIAFSGVLVFAYYRIQSPVSHLTTGGFIAFVGALALLMDPIRKFTQANIRMNKARAAGDRIFKILEEEEEKDTGSALIQEFKDQVEVKNVSFSYGEGSQVLDNLSFTLKKGQRIALVGLSGSGKSTLIQLLLRFYSPSKGSISLDGKEISEYQLFPFRNLFGLVSQDVFLLNDTVLENLCLGHDFSEAQVKEALKVAGAWEFVQDLPQGLQSLIGDRGTKLSGGQAQRLTIARAYLRNTPIFLFDEATSALDNESEKVVQKALDRLAGNKTILAIAHRLTTIQNYDHIIVLKEGRKVEEGTHEQLMDRNGEYRRLYELSLSH